MERVDENIFTKKIFSSLDDMENTLQQALLNYHQDKEAIKKLGKEFIPN